MMEHDDDDDRHDGGHSLTDHIVRELLLGPDGEIEVSKRGRDGMLQRAAGGSQGVILRAMTAIEKNKDYRQEIKVANYGSPDEADMAISALDECSVLGMDPTPIIDQILARSAGRNHELLYEALRTITHTTFTTNYRKDKKADKGGLKGTSPF